MSSETLCGVKQSKGARRKEGLGFIGSPDLYSLTRDMILEGSQGTACSHDNKPHPAKSSHVKQRDHLMQVRMRN